MSHTVPIAVFLSLIEAEYFAWKSDREGRKDSLGMFSYHYSYYSVSEIDVYPEQIKDKSFEKFKKEKLKEIDLEIEKNREHSESDLNKAGELNMKRALYE